MKTFKYKCLKVQQRTSGEAPEFLLFSASANEVLAWSEINRLTPTTPTGTQRIEKPYKVSSIKKYFEVDAANTIPTAVVIALRTDGVELKAIEGTPDLFELNIKVDDIPNSRKPGTIVDGQHRVLGVSAFDGNTRVNIVGLHGASDTEVAFQFLVINNKAAKVSSDHLRTLALAFDEGHLKDRLQQVRLSLDVNLKFVGLANSVDESPFKGMLALSTVEAEKQILTPSAIEDSVNYIKSQKLPEFAEDDMVASVFFGIWRVIKQEWNPLWNANSRLLQKVSVVCLTQFIVDHLMRRFDWEEFDLFDPAKVEGEVKKVTTALSSEFWTDATEWTAKGLDTSAGKKLFIDALEQMVRNKRMELPWYADIPMVGPRNTG